MSEGMIVCAENDEGKLAYLSPEKDIEDGILIKSDGMPTYNFANVIDDHLMGSQGKCSGIFQHFVNFFQDFVYVHGNTSFL